jgi:hypothetical protein
VDLAEHVAALAVGGDLEAARMVGELLMRLLGAVGTAAEGAAILDLEVERVRRGGGETDG